MFLANTLSQATVSHKNLCQCHKFPFTISEEADYNGVDSMNDLVIAFFGVHYVRFIKA